MANSNSYQSHGSASAESQAASRGRTAAHLQQLLEHDSENGRLWELVGVLAYESNDFQLAQSAIERASALIPLSARGQLVLARCYDRSGNRESAGAIYRHISELGDLAVDLREPLAAGLGRHGELEMALNVCRQAASELPESTAPLMGMIYFMRRLGRPQELILAVALRACNLDPHNFECRITAAWLLHEAGRSQEGGTLLMEVDASPCPCESCRVRMERIFAHALQGSHAAADLGAGRREGGRM